MSGVGWGGAIVGWHQTGSLEAQIAALEAEVSKVQTAATVSALPDPATLPDGTLAAVLNASANGMPSILMVRSGLWVQPLEAFPPTISFVIQSGGGAGELPEDVVVGVGATGVLGVGWVLDADNSFARPSGIAVLPLDPDDLTLGVNGSGLWRIAVEINYSSPAPGTAILTRFFLQRDTGGGFVDMPNGELHRLAQGAADNITGISGVGLALNETLAAGDSFRVVVRHNAAAPVTYTINKFSLAMNEIAATPT